MTTEQLGELSEPTSTESTVADAGPRTRRKVSVITRRAKSDYRKAWGNVLRILEIYHETQIGTSLDHTNIQTERSPAQDLPSLA